MLCLCIYTNKIADDNAIGAVQYCRGWNLSVALSWWKLLKFENLNMAPVDGFLFFWDCFPLASFIHVDNDVPSLQLYVVRMYSVFELLGWY